ncbi:MAG: hypothetical protein MJB57_12945 [Gemmatimonadetes bacterium]|nr:hypothetical protein [Gemmatimonadota bacterium]
MKGHLSTERISALLDEPWADKDGQSHLEACRECQAEFERLSRVRMTLSALGDEDPPAGQWAAIEAALDEARVGVDPSVLPMHHRVVRRFSTPGPLQAAAALALFAGGVFAGIRLTGSSVPASEGGADDLPGVISSSTENRALFDGLTQLESFRTPLQQVGIGGDPTTSTDANDPLEATQRLAELEGYIRALREQLARDPNDPVANAYLLDFIEQRDQLLQASVRREGVVTW